MLRALIASLVCAMAACNHSESDTPPEPVLPIRIAPSCSGGSQAIAWSQNPDPATRRDRFSCHDQARDGTETDVDCGGASCGLCGFLKRCSVDDDCAELVCIDGRCTEPFGP